jgi:hypothetical protein
MTKESPAFREGGGEGWMKGGKSKKISKEKVDKP